MFLVFNFSSIVYFKKSISFKLSFIGTFIHNKQCCCHYHHTKHFRKWLCFKKKI